MRKYIAEGAHTRIHRITERESCTDYVLFLIIVILIVCKLKADEAWYAGRGYNVLLKCKSGVR